MKWISTKEIERRAADLLSTANAHALPVPVDRIAHSLGLDIEPAQLGDDVSGLLVVKEGVGTIGVNQSHPPVRQRFTVAHEIGHYMLHRHASGLFIDKAYNAVYRDSKASKGEHRAEIQANQFAAALLMPQDLIVQEVQSQDFDLADEEALPGLAQRFQVSQQALSFRLSNLKIFPSL